MTNPTTAAGILAEGTMRAACLMAPDDVDAGRLSEALKVTIKAEYAGILEEWKAAVEVHMPETMLRYQMNVQCNWLATKALELYNEGEV